MLDQSTLENLPSFYKLSIHIMGGYILKQKKLKIEDLSKICSDECEEELETVNLEETQDLLHEDEAMLTEEAEESEYMQKDAVKTNQTEVGTHLLFLCLKTFQKKSSLKKAEMKPKCLPIL